MGIYDHLTREELIARLEHSEQNENAELRNRLDGVKHLAQALMLMLKNYDSNYEEDIMRIVLERYQADRAFLFKFDWQKNTHSSIYEINSPGIPSNKMYLQDLPVDGLSDYLELFREGVPLVIHHIEQMPDNPSKNPYHIKEIFRQLHIKSAILFPIHLLGELWGYVGMETTQVYRNWTEDEIEWLKTFTDVLNIGISQRIFRTEARNHERQFFELFQHMPVGYIRHRLIYDESHRPVDYEFLEINPAFEELTGLSKQQCIGKTARQLRGKLNDELFQLYIEVATTGKHAQIDYPASLCNKYFYSVLYSPQPDEFISLFYDITDKIKATEKILQNEKKLRTVFDNLPIGTISFDRDRKYLSANAEAFRIFGISKEGIRSNDLILSPQEVEILKQEGQFEYDFIYDPESQQALSVENDLPETALFVNTKTIMYTDNAGNCLGYLLIAVDNTKIHKINRQLSKTEKALTENLLRLSLILETGQIYPLYMDLETGSMDINEDFYKTFGAVKEKYADYKIGDFMKDMHPEDVRIFREEFEKLQHGLIQRIKLDIRLNIFGKGYIWCELNATPKTRGINSNITTWLGFLTIIQKRKDNERQLREALKKAEESDRLKSAFLANVSHEIRTPLNAIVGFSELIANTNEEEEKKYYLDIVKTNNTLLLNLINDILDLSKIESGRMDLQETTVNVRELCQEICQVHQLRAKPGVAVIFESAGQSLIMKTDRNRLTQLYSNLINNAIKNTEEGSITIGYRRKGKMIEFFVRDTGKGIPKDKQTAIFNRFEKLNSNVQGFGLGLSICKSILEKMQGSILVTSEEGKGTEFRFTLPFRGAEDSRPEIQITVKTEDFPKPSPSPATHKNILIAEDIDCNYELLEAALGGKYKLIRALTGIEAVSLFASENPALILMDMKMPELDGIEATQIIREVSPDVPIIALTAFSYDTDRETALQAGCNDFMTKPIDAQQLKALIDKYLS